MIGKIMLIIIFTIVGVVEYWETVENYADPWFVFIMLGIILAVLTGLWSGGTK